MSIHKIFVLLLVTSSLVACTPSYYNRPVQNVSVGGDRFLDYLTGEKRVALITKQAHYDSFVSVPKYSKWRNYPIIGWFIEPDYEICAAPPADAMAASAASFAAALSVSVETKAQVSGTLASNLADSYANSVQAFAMRSQGLQYLRDERFNNCLRWINRGDDITKNEADKLKAELRYDNAIATTNAHALIKQELDLCLSGDKNKCLPHGVQLSEKTVATLAEAVAKGVKKAEEEPKK